MSRRIDICPTCKGKGEIIIDNWLTEGMTEEELANEKEKVLADIVEVVRCKDCLYSHFNTSSLRYSCQREYPRQHREEDDYCSYGKRRENGT